MKKIVFFVVMFITLSTQCFSQELKEYQNFTSNQELGGEAKIKECSEIIVENNSTKSFKIEIDEAGDYFIHFWILPSKDRNGNLSTYTVSVNNNMLLEPINTLKNDWHSATLKNNVKISLNKGLNIITIHGTTSNFPNVEHIKISKSLPRATIDSSTYEEYKNKIIKNISLSTEGL